MNNLLRMPFQLERAAVRTPSQGGSRNPETIPCARPEGTTAAIIHPEARQEKRAVARASQGSSADSERSRLRGIAHGVLRRSLLGRRRMRIGLRDPRVETNPESGIAGAGRSSPKGSQNGADSDDVAGRLVSAEAGQESEASEGGGALRAQAGSVDRAGESRELDRLRSEKKRDRHRSADHEVDGGGHHRKRGADARAQGKTPGHDLDRVTREECGEGPAQFACGWRIQQRHSGGADGPRSGDEKGTYDGDHGESPHHAAGATTASGPIGSRYAQTSRPRQKCTVSRNQAVSPTSGSQDPPSDPQDRHRLADLIVRKPL